MNNAKSKEQPKIIPIINKDDLFRISPKIPLIKRYNSWTYYSNKSLMKESNG